MSRSRAFRDLIRALRVAQFCEAGKIPTSEGLERAAARLDARQAHRPSRRDFLARAGAGALAGGASLLTPFTRQAFAAPRPPAVDVAIVGAGLAGLACADTLRARGIAATVYEARERVGGRVFSMGGAFPAPVAFPGQVLERGGELIDTTHLTMKSYAREFGIGLEEMAKEWLPGESRFHLRGQLVPEAAVVDEWRALVGRLRPDLALLSNYVDAFTFTEFDRDIDETSLAEYLSMRGASPLITAALDVAFTTEYGVESPSRAPCRCSSSCTSTAVRASSRSACSATSAITAPGATNSFRGRSRRGCRNRSRTATGCWPCAMDRRAARAHAE